MLGNTAHVNLEHMPAPARRATHTLRGQARTFGAALRGAGRAVIATSCKFRESADQVLLMF